MAAVPLDGAVPVCDRTERIRHAVSLRRTDMPSQPLATNRNPRKPSPVSSHVTPLCHTAAWPPLYRIYLSRAPCAASAHAPPHRLAVPTPGMVVAIEGLGDVGALSLFPRAARGVNSNSTFVRTLSFTPWSPFRATHPRATPPPQGGTSVQSYYLEPSLSALSCCSSSAA